MKKILIFILTFFLFSPLAFAEFKCDGSLKDYAKESIELELSGQRYSDNGQCLSQDKFKYVYSVQDPIGEGAGEIKIVKRGDFKVVSVESVPWKKHVYRVVFKVKSEGKIYNDEIYMWHRKDKKYGCVATLNFPKNLYLYSDCQ